MKLALIVLFTLSSSILADDLSRLYEKAYFLETAKGQTEQALEIYGRIATSSAAEHDSRIVILSLERMLLLHKRENNQNLQEKVDHFNLAPAIEEHVISTFGEPDAYLGALDAVYTKADLPSTFTMVYPGGFSVAIMSGRIHELRFNEPNYSTNGIRIGTTLEDVLKIYPPLKTLSGNQPSNGMRVEKGTLYRNFGIEGTASYNTGTGIRLFFTKGKVSNLSLYDPNWPRKNR